MTRRDLVVGEHDEEWFPLGAPPPATLSPTRPLGRKPAAIPEGLLDRSRPTAWPGAPAGRRGVVAAV